MSLEKSRPVEEGGEKVSREFLPQSEKEKHRLEVVYNRWQAISDALDRGDEAEAERLRKGFNELLIEMGIIEHELDREALERNMELYFKSDRAIPDEIEITDEPDEVSRVVGEILEHEAEQETRNLHNKKSEQN